MAIWLRGERGLALYSSVPESVTKHPDPLFYDLLTLIDAIRSGRVRERNIAIKLLREKIHHKSYAQTRIIKSEDAGDSCENTRHIER